MWKWSQWARIRRDLVAALLFTRWCGKVDDDNSVQSIYVPIVVCLFGRRNVSHSQVKSKMVILLVLQVNTLWFSGFVCWFWCLNVAETGTGNEWMGWMIGCGQSRSPVGQRDPFNNCVCVCVVHQREDDRWLILIIDSTASLVLNNQKLFIHIINVYSQHMLRRCWTILTSFIGI